MIAVVVAALWTMGTLGPGLAADAPQKIISPGLMAMLGLSGASSGLLAVATYVLTARLRPSKTRCRKCGYILRGITEPRCPELTM